MCSSQSVQLPSRLRPGSSGEVVHIAHIAASGVVRGVKAAAHGVAVGASDTARAAKTVEKKVSAPSANSGK